jgi:hypothetical protein
MVISPRRRRAEKPVNKRGEKEKIVVGWGVKGCEQSREVIWREGTLLNRSGGATEFLHSC